MTNTSRSDAEGRQDRSLPEVPILPRAWTVPAPGNRSVGGVRLGNDDGRRALFVHGVPGSSQNVRFLDLSGRAALVAGVSLVAIDRPGIGYTTPSTHRGTCPAPWRRSGRHASRMRGSSDCGRRGTSPSCLSWPSRC